MAACRRVCRYFPGLLDYSDSRRSAPSQMVSQALGTSWSVRAAGVSAGKACPQGPWTRLGGPAAKERAFAVRLSISTVSAWCWLIACEPVFLYHSFTFQILQFLLEKDFNLQTQVG